MKPEAPLRQCIKRGPEHQSRARKPPDLPEAAAATSVRSTTMTSIPR